MDEDLLEDLPDEARKLLDEARDETFELEQEAHAAVQQIEARARLEIGRIEGTLAQRLGEQRAQLMAKLKPLQDSYARKGKLDEALAIRAQVRALRVAVPRAEAAPEDLTNYGPQDLGRNLVFDLVGSTSGPVWGTDVYTLDSSLAAAAVHAGVLRAGQRGRVQVTLEVTEGLTFRGSRRNSVTSQSWDDYALGYRLALPPG